MYGFAAGAGCYTELMKADADPFWIEAVGWGGKADAALALRLLLANIISRRIHPKRDYLIAGSC